MRGIPAHQYVAVMKRLLRELDYKDECVYDKRNNIKGPMHLQRLKMLNISMLKKRNLDLKELMFVLIYKLSDYVGFIPYRLANESSTLDWLDSNVEKFFNVAQRARYLTTAGLIEIYYKKIVKKITSAVKKDYDGFDLNLDRKFSEFKRRLSRAISRGKSFVALATKRRNSWISMTCKLYKLDPQDLEIQKIYNSLIADDPATIALERMNNILESAIITEDEERFCKYVFYTCKLSGGTGVGVSKLGTKYDEFKKWVDFLLLPDNIESIINDRNEYTEYFLTEETRKKIEEKFFWNRNQSGKEQDTDIDKSQTRRRSLSLGSPDLSGTQVASSRSNSQGSPNSSKTPSRRIRGRSVSFDSGQTQAFRTRGRSNSEIKDENRLRNERFEVSKKILKEDYTGNTVFNLYEKKPDLLNSKVCDFLDGRSEEFNTIVDYLTRKASITIIDDKNRSYVVDLPASFKEFIKILSETKNKADKLREEIRETGKVKRDKWLKEKCDLYHLDVNDKRVKEIYTEAIADDPTITTSKRLAGVSSGLNAALEDNKGEYKNAFYTLKLLSGDAIKQVDIPRGCGLGSGITSAFLMVPEFNAILEEGTLDREFYLNKRTRDTIDKKLKKLAPPSELPKEAFEAMGMKPPASSTASKRDEESSEYKNRSVKDIARDLEDKLSSNASKNR